MPVQENVTDEELLRRLRRVEGQVRGVARMVEEKRYCIDVANQVSAARAALGQVAMLVLHRHLNSCVKRAMGEGRGEALTDEFIESLQLLIK